MSTSHKSTRAQVIKAQVTCALSALCACGCIALAPIQSALGITAAERFRAMQNLNNDGGVTKNRWFTVTMLLILVGSITALIIVSLYRKLREGRRRKTEDRGRKKNFTAENAEGNLIKKISANSVASAAGAPGIEQRVLNIEKQVSAIEKRLTNLEQEVSSFEVIEADSTSSPQDESNVIQASANADEGTK